ncbi:GRB2-associated-binding protein 1-like isoform X1 [Poeciliopsis prolifica]|uniref:GRB2-associated-binding protein 1-like isoform X1 n=1 Tax=Poeciliopsis prolifica TaxID=188132 RepID=UPI0024140E69|nr:GRB2-associated-binding protein 1-like isoform X1 [Poeciliopsis prolifica]XP_054916861.1 GRB2-associated-binding protein 1-like isoform X1 [Poeciliopsis prolifica]
MSGAGDVVCEGWLRKSPPEKKLRRYAWKRRWFVLRSGRLSGEPDVLQYYKNQHSRRPIGTINLNLCELVDAGLSFTKKELESSFVFDLRTEERTWYLVAESEEDMNRWVTSICLLCGFNPTDDAAERQLRSNSASTSVTATRGTPTTTMVSGSIPPPYDPVGVRHLEHDSSAEDDYLWLSNCQTHTRPALGSSTSLETDYSGNLYPPPSATYSSSSSCSSSSSLPPTSLPPPTLSGFRSAPWTMIAMASPLSQSLDATLTSDFQKRASRCHGHPSPHPRKHSLDFHLRPAATTLSDDNRSNAHPSSTTSGYQVPRPASTPQLPPPHRPSSTPSVDSLTQAELHAAIPPPPPRPPKPPAVTLPAEIAAVGTGPGALPRANSEPERRDEGISRGTLTKGSESVFIPRTQSDRATVFEFSESFNTYFFNKGMVPLGSLCSEDDDLDESYVPMSASTNEPPVAARANPGGPSDFTAELQDGNYVPMTPLTSSLPAYPVAAAGDLALLGRQVPPPAHMGFRNPTVTPVVSSTLPLRRNTMHNTSGGEAEVAPPPIHRNLKPQRKGVCGSQSVEKNSSQIPAETTHKTKVKPAPLEITPVSQDWQEVPPPVRSPVTRTFTRGPSIRGSFRPSSAQSSSPSSDSDDPDDSYVSMVTSSLSQSAGEQSLRMMVHRGSEGGVSSPLAQRAEKQVEYLDLDLHTGRSTPTRQKRSTAAGGPGSSHQAAAGDERARGDRRRVDYVVVDPKRTKALKNTREAWHDGRMSTEKEKS